jgi:hypothetical protein
MEVRMQTLGAKVAWVLAGLLGLTLAASWVGVITAGPLDPPGDPASTMQSLDDIPGSWSRMLSSAGGCDSERFDCVLLNEEGVLDRETGLVWEREPSTDTLDWDTAIRACHDRNVGGRLGWRLPSVAELLSLLGTPSADGLPAGHPFTLAGPTDVYWASTRNTASSGRSMRVDISDASVVDELVANPQQVWCVRGPGGGDVQ